MSGQTLTEVLASGRGVERPYLCTEAEHSSPTGSVNVVKGLYICYSCGARGAVDSKRVPSVDELLSMLEPEQAARDYPMSWLSTFGIGGYWMERFPTWLCQIFDLGEDPWTGEGTYPVFTAGGRLAGVCRRALTEGPWPKYRYPSGWSVSRTLLGLRSAIRPIKVVSLHEGMADALALREVGVEAFGVGGSGLHMPQVEIVLGMRPDVVLLGYDSDEAGQRATETDLEQLAPHCQTAVIDWGSYKDPADAPAEHRLEAALDALATTTADVLGTYTAWQTNVGIACHTLEGTVYA